METESVFNSTPTENKPIEIWDNSKRAKAVLTVFGILIGLTMIGMLSTYFELQLLERAQDGMMVTIDEAEANDTRQQMIGVVQIALYIASVIVFLNWFRRAYGNLHRLGLKTVKHEEQMALWTWIIPIISLFRPYQIMQEIWDTTQSFIKRLDPSYVIRSGGLVLGIWWGLFLISNVLGRIIFRGAMDAETVPQMIDNDHMSLISDALQIPEALAVMFIVLTMSGIESKLATEVDKAGGVVVSK